MNLLRARKIIAMLAVSLVAGSLGLPSSALADGAKNDSEKQSAVSEAEEYIVKLRDSGRVRAFAAAVSRNAELVQQDEQYMLIKPPSHLREQVLQTLADDPDVEYIEPNIRMYKASMHKGAEIDDPLYPEQWGLEAIEAPRAWGKLDSSRQAVVAVIDTGVDYTHPDLAGRVDTENDYDFVNRDDDAMDDDYEGHGTHVAGIIAAVANDEGIVGVAGRAKVKILPLKVFDKWGNGNMYDTAMAIMYAADQGADVINLSLGGNRKDLGRSGPRLLQEAVDYAIAKGAVVVAAAGNSGTDVNDFVPASLPGVIAVSALDSNQKLASFSNRGSAISLAAPGVGILSTVPGGEYESKSGTSMAAPFVSGTAALLKIQEAKLSVKDAQNRLRLSATDLGSKGFDSKYGYGLVNAYGALTYKASTKAPEQKLSKLSADVSSLFFKPGETAALTVTAVYADKSKQVVTGDAKWKSSNEKVATVEQGVVTAHGFGKANITAEYGGKKVTIPVYVSLKKLEASVKQLSLKPNAEQMLQIYATYGDNSREEVDPSLVSWKSGNDKIASIQPDGTVRAKKTGTATIYAAYGGKTVRIAVDILPRKLWTDETSLVMKPGEIYRPVIKAKFADGTVLEVQDDVEKWTSSNKKAAFVDSDGTITAVNPGSSAITAYYGGKKVRITLKVKK